MNDPEKILAAFTESLKGDSYKKWLYKADRMLSYYTAQRETAWRAEDIVSEIIRKTIDEGGRNWDMEKIPLDAYMMKTIESEVWNVTRKDAVTEKMDFNNYGDNSGAAEIISRHSHKPEDIYRESDFKEMYEQCLEALSDDPDCLRVFREMRNGATEEQTGEICGMDARKILSVKQRIRRKLKKKIFYNNT